MYLADSFEKNHKQYEEKLFCGRDQRPHLTFCASFYFEKMKHSKFRTVFLSFQVSWLKREQGSAGMPVLLTFGSTIYISDARISIKRYTDDWVLSIIHVKPEDEGVYECQVNHIRIKDDLVL